MEEIRSEQLFQQSIPIDCDDFDEYYSHHSLIFPECEESIFEKEQRKKRYVEHRNRIMKIRNIWWSIQIEKTRPTSINKQRETKVENCNCCIGDRKNASTIFINCGHGICCECVIQCISTLENTCQTCKQSMTCLQSDDANVIYQLQEEKIRVYEKSFMP